MRLRFLTTCLAVLITASTGFCQDATGKPAEPVRSVNPEPNAPTPARDIQILNPDGTPATDAKVVAVLTSPGGMVDQDLNPRQVRKGDRQPLFELANTNGTVKIIFDSTQAIVASNEQGFLFLPASAFADKARLREWAHVELDVSTVPEDLRADITLNVTWTNSLHGMYVRPQKNRDPFHDDFDRPEKIEPKLDWRFDPMTTWTHSVPVTNQSVRVPPGEIMVSLVSKRLNDEAQLLSELPPGSCAATVGLWQTPGGTVQQIALPEFGTVEGMIQKDTSSTFPDWSHSGSETIKFSLNCGLTADRPQILSPSGSNDEYFSKLASDEGFKARRDWAASSMTTSSDGTFRFPLVPVGTYSIHKLIESRKLPTGIPGQLAGVTVPLKPGGDNPSIVVNAKNTTVVNVTELPQPAAFVEVEYVEETSIVDGKEVTLKIPRVVSRIPPELGSYSSPDAPASTPTPTRQIQLLNPDGTPAADSKASVIRMTGAAAPMVNTDLELTPTNLAGRQQDAQSIIKLENDHGTVLSPADAKAIVASNDQGFVFLPSNAQIQTAQLRAWASVRIDTSSIPDTMKDKLKLRILWSNNFCGMYPGHGLMTGLGVPLAKKDPSPDWRFDPFVYWCRDLKVRENADTFKVPPGEVSVMLIAMDSTPVNWLLASHMIVHGITTSNATTEIVFPKSGSLRGTLASMNKSGLPDWGQSGRIRVGLNPVPEKSAAAMELHRRFGNIASPNVANINGVPRVEPTAQDWNDYADFLSTDDGFGFRTNGFQSLMTEVESDRSFLFPLVPVGEYTLTQLTPVASPPDLISRTGEPSDHLSFSVEAFVQSGDEQRTPLKVTVKENECNDLAQLAAAATDTSHVITYSPPPDTATLLVQDWLRSAKDPSDQAELRKLLQDHLQQEFEANQASRKAEVERLQRLLLQSVEWLDKRAKNRDEIIQKRIDELIHNSVSNTPDGR